MEIPLARTNFHGPKPVRAIEVLLYNCTVLNDDDTKDARNILRYTGLYMSAILILNLLKSWGKEKK